MDSVDLEVLRAARTWLAGGQRAVLATVTRTWGSAPRLPGALLAVREDGLVTGSVSGGCVEDDLVERCRAGLADRLATPSLATYGVTREEAARFGLPCGGTLELVLQPLAATDLGWIDALLAALTEQQHTASVLDMRSGSVRLEPAARHEAQTFDGQVLRRVHGPRWRLLVIGAGQSSRCLAEMAQALDYEVAVCDPRAEYRDAWQVPGTHFSNDYPDDFVRQARPDAHTAVVALTHDPKLDDAALLEALVSDAFYVGALGSMRNNDARRQRLTELDVPAAAITRLHGPVGLPIGSRTPPEIAVAILAELIAVRQGVGLVRQSGPAAAATPAGAASCA